MVLAVLQVVEEVGQKIMARKALIEDLEEADLEEAEE